MFNHLPLDLDLQEVEPLDVTINNLKSIKKRIEYLNSLKDSDHTPDQFSYILSLIYEDALASIDESIDYKPLNRILNSLEFREDNLQLVISTLLVLQPKSHLIPQYHIFFNKCKSHLNILDIDVNDILKSE